MKKLLSLVFLFMMVMTATGCGAEEKVAVLPNTFPIGTDKVNEILAENELDMYAVPLEFENTLRDTVVEYYNIFHSSDDRAAGSLQTYCGPDGISSQFSYYTMFDDYYRQDGALEQAVTTACDAFGDISAKDRIAQDMLSGVENRELVFGGETHRYWHGNYGSVYVLALYRYDTLEDIDNDVLTFGYVSVMDEAVFRNHLERNGAQEWAQQIYSEYFE